MFTSETSALTTQYWLNLGGDPTAFKCSDQFTFDFKMRSRFSLRRFQMRQRNPHESKADGARWARQIMDLLLEYDDVLWLVVNCDKTAWRMMSSGLWTWGPDRAHGVPVPHDGGEKYSVTVLASVTAHGEKLLLFTIAKG
jgi:hypothetical protein